MICMFQAQREERLFRLRTVSDVGDAQISAIFHEFSKSMKDINDADVINQTEEEIMRMSVELDEFMEKQSRLISEKNKEAENVDKLRANVDSLNRAIGEKGEEVNKAWNRWTEEVKRLESFKEKIAEDIKEVGENMDLKIAELKRNSEKRLTKMTKEHNRKICELNDSGQGCEEEKVDYSEMVEQLARIREMKVNEESQMQQQMRENRLFVERQRSEVLRVCHEMRGEYPALQRERDALVARINKETNDWDTAKSELLKRKIDGEGVDVVELREIKAKETERIKAELEKVATSQVTDDDTVMEKVHEKESADLKERFASERRISNDRVSSINATIDSTRKRNEAAAAERSEYLRAKIAAFRRKETQMRNTVEGKRDEIRTAQSAEATALKQKIDEMTSSSEFASAQKDLRRLKKEPTKLSSLHQKMLNEMISTEESEIGKVNTTHEAVAAENANETERAKDCLRARRIELVEQRKKEHVEEKEKTEEKIEKTKPIDLEYGKGEEYIALRAEFKETLRTLNEELTSIVPPAIADKDAFEQLNAEMEELENTKVGMWKSIGTDRDSLAVEWQEKIDREMARHASVIKPGRSGRGRAQAVQALEQSVKGERISREEVLAQLEETKAEEDAEHGRKLLELQEEKIAFVSAFESEKELKLESLANIRSEMENIPEDNDQSEFAELRETIAKTGRDYEDRISRLKSILSDLEEKSDRDSGQSYAANSELEQVMEAETAALNRELGDMQFEHQRWVTNFLPLIQDEQDRVNEADATFMKELRRDFALCESHLHDSRKRIMENEKKYSHEMKGVVGFYEERVAVLEAQVAKYAGLCDNQGSRPCDAHRIDQLRGELREMNMKFQHYSKDLIEYQAAAAPEVGV